MRWPFVFLLGAACGAVAMLPLTGRWSATLPGRGSHVREVPAAAALPAPATSQQRATPAAPAASVDPRPVGSLPEAAPAASSTAPAVAASVGPATPEPSAVNGLLIPVVGVKASELVDTFTQARGAGRVHDAIDIMAARGTPVVAANDGHVVKLFTSKPGGLTVYQFDPHDQVIYYYAHLDSYAPGLAEGQILHRGDPIGFVGSTGNASADAPHLHFEIQILGPEKQWWHATSINPYGRFAGQ
jgi:murein DD-endopeptidase MepM/ murein hydrolase activator NlpD